MGESGKFSTLLVLSWPHCTWIGSLNLAVDAIMPNILWKHEVSFPHGKMEICPVLPPLPNFTYLGMQSLGWGSSYC